MEKRECLLEQRTQGHTSKTCFIHGKHNEIKKIKASKIGIEVKDSQHLR